MRIFLTAEQLYCYLTIKVALRMVYLVKVHTIAIDKRLTGFNVVILVTWL